MHNETSDIQVTVVILTKNPGEIFKEVLFAVLDQETPWAFEVLVIDSGSSDGTLDFIRKQSDVRLIEIPAIEFGHGKTRNLAISHAHGRFVAMLTHDAKPANRDWLDNLIKPFNSDKSIGGVFGRHIAYPEASPCIKRDIDSHFDQFLEYPSIMGIENPDRYEWDQGYQQVLHYFSNNNACLRKSVWEKVPFPNVCFSEDQLWAKRMLEKGYKRAYANDAIVYHSHDYSVFDTLRRSIDESRALKNLFGYDLCPSLIHGILNTFACTLRDLKYLGKSLNIYKSPLLVLRTPLLNVAKQLGYYAGAHQIPFEKHFFQFLSLDNAMKRS